MIEASWMSNPNIRLFLYVAMLTMPIIIADIAADRVGWLSAAIATLGALTAAKAFMSDPKTPTTSPIEQPKPEEPPKKE